ncbi:acetyl-CoA carboxylase biotin carboxylase subunit family protein [Streptomyces sp. cg36]|uniref:ATP-grasp domain-containing protein n=1 Tax=Streptomyces sp. cg36 TaxID=3238798 RepID=UPI0034E195DE
MTEHVLVFGVGSDTPARMRAFGERTGQRVTASLMCRPEHLAGIVDIGAYERIVVVGRDASDEEWIALARSVHTVDPVTGIGSFHDDCRPQAAVVAQVLGLDACTPELVELLGDEHATRERLIRAGVEDAAAGEAESVGGLPAGDRYRVAALSEQGEHQVVAVVRTYLDPVGRGELGHAVPAPLGSTARASVERRVVAALEALGVECGPTRTEVVLTGDGPRVLAVRLGAHGDELGAMVTGATGVDLVESQFRQVLGEKVLPGIRAVLDAPGSPARGEALWFAGARARGTLVEVAGAEGERPDAVTLRVVGVPGTDLAGSRDGFARLAWARAHAATAEEAVALAREAVGGLSFVIRFPASQGELP